MKRYFTFILATMVILTSLLTGCEEELSSMQKEQSASYLSLIQAYEAGKVFSSVTTSSSSVKVVRFEDGSYVNVPQEDFEIEDCTSSSPKSVQSSGGWWQVGDKILPIKVETTLSNKDAEPVYVYYDTVTLYMRLSNGAKLVFPTSTPEEEVVPQTKNIPIVTIMTDGAKGIYDKKNYVPGSITISDPDKIYSDVEVFSARMGIRGRGNSTWDWPKKPWKVKLDEKASLLGMPKDKEWALLANYADRTLLRNITAMRMSEICGFSWTPRMYSVEVYLNGAYQGVYTLCEHKKVSKDRVNIDLVTENDNSGDALTGGYYLEIEEQQDETTCWWTAMGVPMMFSDPEEPTDAQYAYMTGYINEFEQALSDKDFKKAYEYIDVPSLINYYIVQEITKNVDGNLRKSSFITKERGKKMEMYHLWDFDLTLGNCGYFPWEVGNGSENFWIKDYKSNSTYGGGWFWMLFQDPDFVDAVQQRWNELLPQLQTIPQFIDEQALLIEAARIRNFQKWSIKESVGWVNFPSLGSYEKELDYLKTFYTERVEWLNTEINKL
ncbi:MAG: CotH kinase family protein [Bacteroidales bacterium]|nr:CotH kinase family protein [Bacteroidales bacterium]